MCESTEDFPFYWCLIPLNCSTCFKEILMSDVNCGNVRHVIMLSTNETDWAWRGDLPMFPRVVLGDHFGIELSFCKLVLSERMGHPKIW